MAYVKSNLLPGEEIIRMGKIHWFIYVRGSIFVFLSIPFLFFHWSMKWVADLDKQQEYQQDFLWIAGPLLVLGLLLIVNAFIARWTTELAVTTKRIIVKRGWIRRDTIELNHSKVESMNVHQSVLGRLLNFGTLTVQGTGGGKTPVKRIAQPMNFRRDAMEIVDRQ